MKNKIIHADVLSGLGQICPDSVSLTFTSPPYNVGLLDYGDHHDDMPYQEYLDWLKKVFKMVYKATRDGGRCGINIDAMTNRQSDNDQEYIRAIWAHIYNFMRKIGWKFYTEICWYKQNAVGKATAWGSYCSCSTPILRRNHEYILVFSKGKWTLDGDAEQSDMTPEEFAEYTLSTWHIPPETRRMGGHPASFPEELASRMIKLFTYRGDIVLDCFNGTGTTTAMAARHDRSYVGIDNDEKFVDYACLRTIKEAKASALTDYIKRSERLSAVKEKRVEKEVKRQKEIDAISLF